SWCSLRADDDLLSRHASTRSAAGPRRRYRRARLGVASHECIDSTGWDGAVGRGWAVSVTGSADQVLQVVAGEEAAQVLLDQGLRVVRAAAGAVRGEDHVRRPPQR